MSRPAQQARVLITNWHERGWTPILALLIAFLAVAWSAPLDDFWLTLASGREILSGAEPGKALPFTHSPMVDGAINAQWGAQVLLAAPRNIEVALALQVALVAGGLLLVYRRVLTGSTATAGVLAMLSAFVVLRPFLVPRVQAFSILLFPVALILIERRVRSWWVPAAYAALMLVWSNVHGAFVLGQVLPLLFLMEPVLMAIRTRKVRETVVENRQLLIIAAVALLVPLVNPVGAALYSHAYGIVGNEEVRRLAPEFDPALPWTKLGAPYWALALAVLAGRPWRHGHRAGELFVLAATFILGATVVRSIPWFVLAATPVFARQIDRWLESPQPMPRGVGSVRRVPPRVFAIPIGIALSAILVQPLRTRLPDPIARLTPIMPVALVNELERRLAASPRKQPIFNYQGWGGYLAYRLGDRVSTYVDGRIETPTPETWDTYLGLMHARPETIGLLDHSGIEWVVVGHHTPLQATLEAIGWDVTFNTPEGVLLERRAGQ